LRGEVQENGRTPKKIRIIKIGKALFMGLFNQLGI